jgi:hypothetical protein
LLNNYLLHPCELKYKGDLENCIDVCIRNGSSGIILLKTGVWELSGTRKGSEEEHCAFVCGV